MGVVDFEDWARPDLTLTYKDKTYRVKPPTVEDAQKILAAAVLGELHLGLVRGEVPDVVRDKLDDLAPDDHFALGDAVYKQMAADGVPAVTIDRMSYYTVFYWARGRDYADALAALMWAPEIALEAASEAVKPTPKSAALLTAEEWADFGVGEPIDHDSNGVPIFADYGFPPESVEAAAPAPDEKPGEQIDATTYAIVTNWKAAVLDVAETFHVDLHDPAVLARPWPPVRDYILSLLVSDSRLRAALTRR